MAELSQIPEPPEGTIVLSGEAGEEEVFRRSDPLGEPDPWRWWPLRGGDGEPVTWGHVCNTEYIGLHESRYEPRPVEELVRRSEVDRLVAEAGLRVVGDHIVAGNYCITCTSHHSTTELARLEDQLAEEVSDDD